MRSSLKIDRNAEVMVDSVLADLERMDCFDAQLELLRKALEDCEEQCGDM